MGEIYRKFYLFIYTFFGNSPTGQTRGQIFMLDGSNDVCLLGVSLILLPILWVKSPQPQFLGANRRFQAKREKY